MEEVAEVVETKSVWSANSGPTNDEPIFEFVVGPKSAPGSVWNANSGPTEDELIFFESV